MSFSSMGAKAGKVRPPDKGAFPLDREHTCREFKKEFLACLQSQQGKHALCRPLSEAYLQCRQSANLMDMTPLHKLGFTEKAAEQARDNVANDKIDPHPERYNDEGQYIAGLHITGPVKKPARRRGGHGV